jgi:putative hydrolase of the HAD superfamily
MKEKDIKNLVFDFGGVLVDLDRQRCIEQFQQIGLENVHQLVSDSFKEGFFQKYELGLISTAEFRNHIRSLSSKSVTDADIDAAWCSFLCSIPAHKLSLLLSLREKYMVYLLSNTNDLHWQWSVEHLFPYKGFDVNSYFEKIYLSFEMHLAKPDINIFKTMTNDAGIEPDETLFIDDSIDNCLTAESFGIHSFVAKNDDDWTRLFEEDK